MQRCRRVYWIDQRSRCCYLLKPRKFQCPVPFKQTKRPKKIHNHPKIHAQKLLHFPIIIYQFLMLVRHIHLNSFSFYVSPNFPKKEALNLINFFEKGELICNLLSTWTELKKKDGSRGVARRSFFGHFSPLLDKKCLQFAMVLWKKFQSIYKKFKPTSPHPLKKFVATPLDGSKQS